LTHEVADGEWGALGEVIRLPDLYEHVVGEKGRPLAEQVLAERRREDAEAVLAAAGVTTAAAMA
jgi:hypothetical protein